jgi:hypothetical protein
MATTFKGKEKRRKLVNTPWMVKMESLPPPLFPSSPLFVLSFPSSVLLYLSCCITSCVTLDMFVAISTCVCVCVLSLACVCAYWR